MSDTLGKDRMPTYQQRDLGYQRTPTDARLLVRFSNGELWSVPAQVVADDRDENYADEEEDTIGFGLWSEISDWASNNMNWCDLLPHATKVDEQPKRFDYEEDWGNAAKHVDGKE